MIYFVVFFSFISILSYIPYLISILFFFYLIYFYIIFLYLIYFYIIFPILFISIFPYSVLSWISFIYSRLSGYSIIIPDIMRDIFYFDEYCGIFIYIICKYILLSKKTKIAGYLRKKYQDIRVENYKIINKKYIGVSIFDSDEYNLIIYIMIENREYNPHLYIMERFRYNIKNYGYCTEILNYFTKIYYLYSYRD